MAENVAGVGFSQRGGPRDPTLTRVGGASGWRKTWPGSDFLGAVAQKIRLWPGLGDIGMADNVAGVGFSQRGGPRDPTLTTVEDGLWERSLSGWFPRTAGGVAGPVQGKQPTSATLASEWLRRMARVGYLLRRQRTSWAVARGP